MKDTKKTLEQKRKEIDPEKVGKKIEAYEDKCQNKPSLRELIKEIKRLHYIKKPNEYKAIKSLSFQLNDVIREAKQADIDRDIIDLLREKQQQFAEIIREHEAVERDISRIDSLTYYGINDSLERKISEIIIRAEKAYFDKNTILQLQEKHLQVIKTIREKKSQD